MPIKTNRTSDGWRTQSQPVISPLRLACDQDLWRGVRRRSSAS
jgi:hypothetical protein